MVMNSRVAKGSQLPTGWSPGQPLPAGSEVGAPTVQPAAECPFGPQCFSCRKGLQWNAEQDKHVGGVGERRVRPQRRRSPN